MSVVGGADRLCPSHFSPRADERATPQKILGGEEATSPPKTTEGFSRQKPLTLLACPCRIPLAYKRRTMAPRKRGGLKQDYTRVRRVEREVISPGQDLLPIYLRPELCRVHPRKPL